MRYKVTNTLLLEINYLWEIQKYHVHDKFAIILMGSEGQDNLNDEIVVSRCIPLPLDNCDKVLIDKLKKMVELHLVTNPSCLPRGVLFAVDPKVDPLAQEIVKQLILGYGSSWCEIVIHFAMPSNALRLFRIFRLPNGHWSLLLDTLKYDKVSMGDTECPEYDLNSFTMQLGEQINHMICYLSTKTPDRLNMEIINQIKMLLTRLTDINDSIDLEICAKETQLKSLLIACKQWETTQRLS